MTVIHDAPLDGIRSLASLVAGDMRERIAEIRWTAPFAAPAGYQFRVRIELERIDQPLDEERELERCRSALMDRGVAPSICNAIEQLASARIARALRVHLDGWHDED